MLKKKKKQEIYAPCLCLRWVTRSSLMRRHSDPLRLERCVVPLEFQGLLSLDLFELRITEVPLTLKRNAHKFAEMSKARISLTSPTVSRSL